MSQAHKPTVLDRAPPTNTSVQFNPDSVKETEEVNSKYVYSVISA